MNMAGNIFFIIMILFVFYFRSATRITIRLCESNSITWMTFDWVGLWRRRQINLQVGCHV